MLMGFIDLLNKLIKLIAEFLYIFEMNSAQFLKRELVDFSFETAVASSDGDE